MSLAVDAGRRYVAFAAEHPDNGRSETRGKTIEMPVEPGRHALHVRNGRKSSSTENFDVTESEIIAFRCTGKRACRLTPYMRGRADRRNSLKQRMDVWATLDANGEWTADP